MPSINLKELSPQGHQLRADKLMRLKQTLKSDRYDVNSTLVASEMLQEALLEAALRRTS